MESCAVASDLLDLRRRLLWEKKELGDYFHATTDKQVVRDAVYETIMRHDFKVQATVMEKSKAQPQVRVDRPRFYKTGWFFHFRSISPKIADATTEIVTTAATLGTNKERASFGNAVDDVMQQVRGNRPWVTNFCPAAADPCLQVADYCAWAIQRKWERNDERSYELIKDRIIYEFDLWHRGTVHHY